MLPQEFCDRMKEMLGEEYTEFLRSFDRERFQALRLNPLKRNEKGEGVSETLQNTFHLTSVSWEENGFYYDAEDQPGKHPFHEAGFYYIQEPSAMAPVPLLQVKPGERVLDLCAAPGGKSTQIAAALGGKGLLVSNEIHPARAKILSENVERMGIWNACVTNETPKHLSEIFPEYFDKILVDAPCSGEGMFRKNEEAGEQWSLENVELCAERQDEILDYAAGMLRAGGRMVYSTCTFAPAENEGSISRFLCRHPEFSLIPIAKDPFVGENASNRADGRTAWSETAVQGMEQTLRLWPHMIKGEGHFAAVLVKSDRGVGGEGDTLPPGMAATGVERGVPEKELGEYSEFVRDHLNISLKDYGKYLRFGEQIYLIHQDMPGIKGLKVLRPGLHVGTLKKNRFEPAHALALALSPTQAKYVWNLDATSARAYLRGETFPAEGEKGWYLICVEGFSLGWGKLAGGVMKNHYPKGLRKPW